MVDIRESLNDQIYISAFNDPTVALETTQFNQTYTFEQKKQTYGNVDDENYLTPDWSPHYSKSMNGTYISTDELEWNLLQPTLIENLVLTPDELLNTTTSLSNDFSPIQRSHYSQDLSYPELSTTQTQVGRLGYSSWLWPKHSVSGQADV